MNYETLGAAIREAESFLQQAKALAGTRKDMKPANHWFDVNVSPRQTAAVKRQSMNLSRALSDMRRAG